MQNLIYSIFQWWFSLFGITEPTYVSLGITLFAVAIGIAVLWIVAIFLMGILAAVVGLK